MRYFLDTEFDGVGGRLISLALVPEDGGEEFYAVIAGTAEVPWVQRHVMPYLDMVPEPLKAPHMSRAEVAEEVARWLAHDDRIEIVADWLAARFAQLDRRHLVRDFTVPELLSNASDAVRRVPYFCAGCPHNTSTKVPEGSRAQAGIGCHFMASWMDRDTEGLIQMGGEGVDWVSHSMFTKVPHVFQNLGDGTYFHSGSLAIRQSIAAGVNITYKILYNDAVAMTGGQPIDGTLKVPEMTRELDAEGARRIVVVTDEPEKYGDADVKSRLAPGVTVHHRDDLDAIQKELREVLGTSVIVYDQTCATEKRRRRKRGTMEDPARRVVINELVCEGCGDCSVQSNCLSVEPVETEFGRKRRINQNTCNKDYSCINGFCPSFVSVIGGKLRRPKTATPATAPADAGAIDANVGAATPATVASKEEGQTEEPCEQPEHHCGRCRKQRIGHRRSPHQRPPGQSQSRARRRGRDHHYDRRRRAVLRRRALSLLRHGGGLILIINHVAIYALIKTI